MVGFKCSGVATQRFSHMHMRANAPRDLPLKPKVLPDDHRNSPKKTPLYPPVKLPCLLPS